MNPAYNDDDDLTHIDPTGTLPRNRFRVFLYYSLGVEREDIAAIKKKSLSWVKEQLCEVYKDLHKGLPGDEELNRRRYIGIAFTRGIFTKENFSLTKHAEKWLRDNGRI